MLENSHVESGVNERAWKEHLYGERRTKRETSHVLGGAGTAQDMTSHTTRLALVVLVAMVFLLPNSAGTIAAVEAPPEILMKQGSQAYQRGAFDQALGAWKQAAQVYEQTLRVDGERQRDGR